MKAHYPKAKMNHFRDVMRVGLLPKWVDRAIERGENPDGEILVALLPGGVPIEVWKRCQEARNL